MNRCINCNKKLKKKIDSFCKRCNAELTFSQKEHLLSGEVMSAINKLGDGF